MLIMTLLMLATDPANVTPQTKRDAVLSALFVNQGEGFVPVKSNEALQALLEKKPELDFFETAAVGNATDLRRQLDADASRIRSRNGFGWTALHMASFAVANVKLLLDRGADVNVRAETKFHNTSLQVALLTGEYDAAKVLLEHGADALVRQNKGFTPMHEAAFMGRVDIIQLLLDHGAELNSRTDDGRSPMSEAMRHNKKDAVEFLKAKGAVDEVGKQNSSPD
jgi:ankyrin repeat protein